MHSKRRTLFLYVFNEGETFVDGRAKTYANILFLYMYDIYILYTYTNKSNIHQKTLYIIHYKYQLEE